MKIKNNFSNFGIQEIIEKLSKIEHGFKPIELEAKKIVDSNSILDSRRVAIELLKHEKYQVRSLSVFMLGYISYKEIDALEILKSHVIKDQSWQVQEILAKAFDQHCKDTGYEQSLPVISDWLSNENSNVCRVVTEGLRIWTARPFFSDNPQIAIQLLSRHKDNQSEYLRKSVGNALRDISKKYKNLVDKEITTWDLSNRMIQFTYRYVIKSKLN
jgi:3-methyladenine DNA glycosylase AlkC